MQASRDATGRLIGLLAQNHRAGIGGITAVCSAHPLVLEAALAMAGRGGQLALIEATCNQVNQFGGYTGMRPGDFVALAHRAAAAAGVSGENVVLGGDHLGPQPFLAEGAAAAMDKAEAMVAEYVAAGFTKIHLDCSMRCVDDPETLSEQTIAARAARLARAAEAARRPGQTLCYVVGTEVPPPGGMADGHAIAPTEPDALAVTIETHRLAFAALGLEAAFERIVAVVVQPGVEFGNDTVVHFDPPRAAPLTEALAATPGLVFEAHSTDYQLPEAYAALVRGRFAILKVGPAATFALREALFALEAGEAELYPAAARSGLSQALESAMLAQPGYWRGHYHGSADQQRLMRRFSFSDRIRYYWTAPPVQAAVEKLIANLDRVDLPLPLLSQHFPQHVEALAAGRLAPRARQLCLAAVERALEPYARATAI